jgi:hypothetical protein
VALVGGGTGARQTVEFHAPPARPPHERLGARPGAGHAWQEDLGRRLDPPGTEGGDARPQPASSSRHTDVFVR